VKVVERIYKRFTEPSCPSLNGIVADLNREGIPSPRGKNWSVAAIRDLMKRPVYKGAFAYGRSQRGKHYVSDEDVNVVKRPSGVLPWNYRKPIVLKEGVYPAIVNRRVWDAAQKRLAILSKKGNRHQRVDGYPLAGILICAKCKKPMYGCQPTDRNYRVYRCITPTRKGMGTCGTFEIREELILPVVWKMLVETMEGGPEKLRPTPPGHLKSSDNDRKDDRAECEAALGELNRKIDLAEDNLLSATDERTLKSLDTKISQMRDERERLLSELNRKEETAYQQEEWEALERWFTENYKKCIRVLVEGVVPDNEYYFSNVVVTEHTKAGTILWSDDGRKLKKEQVQAFVDPRAVNDLLHAAGARVCLTWKTYEVTLSNGKKQNRHEFRYGTFQLGQQTGKLVEKNGVMLSKERFGAPCHDAF
jgi:hypothetical protein